MRIVPTLFSAKPHINDVWHLIGDKTGAVERLQPMQNTCIEFYQTRSLDVAFAFTVLWEIEPRVTSMLVKSCFETTVNLVTVNAKQKLKSSLGFMVVFASGGIV